MKMDYWGFPVVDWARVPRKARPLFNTVKAGEACEGNYLGHPSVLGHILLVTGECRIIGAASILYTYADFQVAAGMPFPAYLAAACMTSDENMTRIQHAAIRETTTWVITYTAKADPFTFKALTLRALDAAGAENYANFVFAAEGNTIMSVEPKS